MKLGNIHIEGQAILAPMAGVTDQPFRRLCRRFGAGYTVTEMVSAKALEFQDKKSNQLMELAEDEHPTAIQLFGNEPKVLAEAAKKAAKFAPELLDLNLGCPAPKIVNAGNGSALLKDPKLCGELVDAVKNAVDIPLTVKLRKGFDKDHITGIEVAQICAEKGADAIVVHGRTREQYYSGQADWAFIGQVKQAVDVPVIGNGDVFSAPDAAKLLETTGCDAVMLGRGALGNPWIFAQCNAFLQNSCTLLPPPSLSQRMLIMLEHIQMLCDYKGEYIGMRQARKHVGWYIKGLKGAAEFRRRGGYLEHYSELVALVGDILQVNQEEKRPQRFVEFAREAIREV